MTKLQLIFRAARAVGVAVVFLHAGLLLANDPGVISPADTETFTGNQADGISVGSPPVLTLNVNNLSGSIHPGSGVNGIYFDSNSAGNLTINSGVVGTPVVISTTGNGANGISTLNLGVPSANTTDPLLGIPVLFHLDGSGNPIANASVSGGVVTTVSYSNITTTGDNANGISGISKTTGYPSSVTNQISSFNPSTVSFTVTQVSGSSGGVGHVVSGQRVDINGNAVSGGGGKFTLNANGSYSFDPGTDFNGLAVGGTSFALVHYQVSGSNSSSHATGTDQGTMIVAVKLLSSGTNPPATNTFSETPGAQFSTFGTSSGVLPDLNAFKASQLLFAGAGGAGGVVNITSKGTIQTSGVNSQGISADSEGGNGSNGRDGSISHGSDQGGAGQTGGKVTVTAGGAIHILENAATSTPSSGIYAVSAGGQGGSGGDGGTFRYGSLGGAGGSGGEAIVHGDATITTVGDKSIGILAVSAGGNAGNGGSGAFVTGGASGGFGGTGGAVTLSGSWNITTQGNQAYGIWAKSTGGNGGAGGSGGWLAGSSAQGGPGTTGGTVSVSSGGRIETFGQYAYGIYAESIGGFGGGGGASGIFVSYAADANAGGSGGDVTINNLAGGAILTHNIGSHAIFAQSVGGSGGTGGSGGALVSIGGAGASGGNGGNVEVTNDGTITTTGSASRGIYAQSVGGGGGDGGNTSGLVAIGGDGSSTSDGGTAKVRNGGNISTTSNAVFAQSVGGGGGNGGSGAGWFSMGGSGGSGGNGGAVTVTSHGQLDTSENMATAIFAQSLGGGGGSGGGSTAVGAFVSLAIGGSGAAGGTGANVLVGVNPDTNAIDPVSGHITTLGDNANGIQAQSIGGGGGNGGFARSIAVGVGGAAALGFGGSGGGGNSAGNVEVYYGDAGSVIHTSGTNSNGIFAQSVGGGGGSGGMSLALAASDSFSAALSFGGKGAGGGNAGTVLVGDASNPLLGQIITTGGHSYGILAQSVGGGGGNGGMSIAGNFSVDGGASLSFGGQGAQGGTGAGVSVDSNSTISTTGSDSHGVFAQSVGGGGGSGGASIAGGLSGGVAIDLSFGGKGGAGSGAGEVDVITGGTSITTHGKRSYGVLAQSIGGGGGDGGLSVAGSISAGPGINLSMGGSAGGGGSAGLVNLINSSSIWTDGAASVGLFAQSLGGGGGNGGLSVAGGISATASISVGVGGSGGGGGAGQTVTLSNTGSTIHTGGADADGILAQSVGGGGGNGGLSVAGSITDGPALGVSIGGSGSTGGNGGIVWVTNKGGSISTTGSNSNGVVAQSIGGGGGNGGFSVAGSLTTGPAANLSIGGNGSGGGSGSAVHLDSGSNITTDGSNANGIFAQSVGGGGGNGGFSVAGGLSTSGALSLSFGGKGAGGGSGGAVTVGDTSLITGTITTAGDLSTGILAQSVGGGGGNGGFSVAGSISESAALGFSMGGGGGTASSGSTVTLRNSASIYTSGSSANAIFAQSIGGGGGNGGFSVNGSISTSSAAIGASVGGAAGGGGAGGIVSLTSTNSTIGTTGNHSDGILAQSVGGGGGNGGFSVAGGISQGASVNVSVGGKGGAGGNANTVTVDNSSDVTTAGQASQGILAQSVGGGGGNGGFSIAGSVSTQSSGLAFSMGGSGGAAGSGSSVSVTNSGTIITGGSNNDGKGSYGILAQSVGGGGGNGGFSGAFTGAFGDSASALSLSIGGNGSGGGGSGPVTVNSTGQISTSSSDSVGIFAQSIGGGGGNGGFSLAAALTTGSGLSASVSIGGSGGTGGNAGATNVTSGKLIQTLGDHSQGILAQSIGGGGGDGGFSISFAGATGSNSKSVSVSVGGKGGVAGNAGAVTVTNDAAIMTGGSNSTGIQAQSIGGGGGDGGFSIAGSLAGTSGKSLSVAVGGTAGGGGFGNTVNVFGSGSNAITTAGDNSHGIQAQSIGGSGGNGGFAAAVTLGLGGNEPDKGSTSISVAVGGGGGTGNTGGAVNVGTVSNFYAGNITTSGSDSMGIQAQSIGGGGGNGGFSLAGAVNLAAGQKGPNTDIAVSVGGFGGSANDGGVVGVYHGGNIDTTGDGSHGIEAQSIGGGGGNGGSSRAFTLQLGTAPTDAEKEAGAGQENKSLSLSIGGFGAGGGKGNAVTVVNVGNITTDGGDAYGIFAQSIGGGGGTGGDGHQGIPGSLLLKKYDRAKFLKNLKIAVGGSGGSSGDGGAVLITNTGNITTHGDGSHAVYAQSIGGGGGTGGAGDVGALGTLGIGGGTGTTGDGKDVGITISGTITTFGNDANGIFAQSIGGGGGVAGNVDRGLKNYLNIGIGLAFGQGGGNAGSGGTVTINSTGDILTNGTASSGIFAQSIGGGGGVVGSLGNDLPILSVLNFAGSVGGDGSGGIVNVTHTGNIITLGDASDGIFAQSAGGKDFGKEVNVTLAGSLLAGGSESNGIFAQSTGGKGGGNITVLITSGTVQGGSDTGAGVRIANGKENTLTSHGTITTVGAIDGMAIIGGSGNETVNNFGTVIGSVELGTGTNTFNHHTGALLESGTGVDLGAGNVFNNAGTISPGAIGRVLATALTGNFTQTGDAIWFFDITPAFTSDLLAISGAASLGNFNNTVNLNELNVPTTTGTYTLVTAVSGMTGTFHFGTLSGGTMPVGETFTLLNSDTQEQVALLASAGAFYWRGAVGNAWNDPFVTGSSDWTSDEAGNNFIYGSPGVACDVIFSGTNAATANRDTVLGADFTVNSVTFNDPNAVSIGGSNTLTLAAAGGAGITVNSGAGPATISTGVVLGGDQTWTNNSSSLLLLNGTSIGGDGKNLTVDGSGTTSIIAPIQTGGGSLTKSGSGLLALSASNNYSGGTFGNAGVLLVINSNALGSGGVLMSGGTLRTLNNPLAKANTALYSQEGGIYSQGAAATLEVRIIGPSGINDRLVIAGAATLNGTFMPDYSALGYNPIPPAGNYTDAFQVITAAGGVSGTFSSFVDVHYDPNHLLRWEPYYEPTDVMLEWVQHPFSELHNLTRNQSSVAGALDVALGIGSPAKPLPYNQSTGPALDAYPSMRPAINFLNLEPLANLPHDYDLIAPEELTSIFTISFSSAGVSDGNIQHRLENLRNGGASGFNATAFNLQDSHGANIALGDLDSLPLFASNGSALDDLQLGHLRTGLNGGDSGAAKMFAPTPDNRWGFFVSGVGEFVHVTSDANASGYKFDTGGVTIGADYRVNDHLVVGLFGGYANTDTALVDNGAVTVNSGKGGVYATAFNNGFYMNALTAWGGNSYQTRRLALNGFASGNTEGWELDSMIGGGYDAHFGKLTVGPVVSMQYTRVAINGFNEMGSSLPLHVESQDEQSLDLQLGAHASYDWKIGKVLVTPEVNAAWQHQVLNNWNSIDARFASGAGNVFTTYGPVIGRDSATVSAGINVQWTPSIGTYVYYGGEFGRTNYHFNSVSGGIRLNF